MTVVNVPDSICSITESPNFVPFIFRREASQSLVFAVQSLQVYDIDRTAN